MKTFTDNAGRTWTVAINVAAVKRCRGLTGVDLYGLIDQDFAGLGRLLGDPVLLVDVLYVLCKDEAEKLGVSDEDFGRAMAGDAIEHASDAFLGELTDFFPDARAREAIRKILATGRKVRDQLLARGMESLDQVDSTAVALKILSGRSPASSGSTRARSRSAS